MRAVSACRYRRARGEKLAKKDLAAAMAEMDTDGDGTISFSEFERWWSANGGDLEVHRDRALTIGAGDLHLLLVAPDMATKTRWIAGCRELLGLAPREPQLESEPAPEPTSELEPEPAPEPTPEREPAPELTASPPRVRMDGRRVPALPMLVVPTKEARDALFNALDANGNGGLSLAEIDKGVVSGAFTKVLSPEGSTGGESFDHKPALMRAYHAADRSKDGFIERSEFAVLLHYMVYFNNMWHKFEAIDSDHDRRLDLAEFTAGCEVLGLEISAEEAEAEFARCDADGGGMILFGEFCAWCAARHVDSTEPESQPESQLEPAPEREPAAARSTKPRSKPGSRVQIPGHEKRSPAPIRTKKKKPSENFPWQDSKLAERTDVKRPSAEQERVKTARLPPKMRPVSASTAHSSPRPGRAPQEKENARAEDAAETANGRRRARADQMIQHQPRLTVYHREKEPDGLWSHLKIERNRRAAERGYATSEASFETADKSAGGTAKESKSTWQSPSSSADKWHLGLSSLSPEELPPKEQFDNFARSPARPTPSSRFSQKTTPNKTPLVAEAAEELTLMGGGMPARDANRAPSPTSLGIRRLSSAAGMGSPRERELTVRD